MAGDERRETISASSACGDRYGASLTKVRMCDWLVVENASMAPPAFDDMGSPMPSAEVGCGDINMTTVAPIMPSSGRPLSSFPEYQASQIIYNYNLWIFWIIGVLGNLAALLTITRMKPFSPVFIYIGSLAACDIVYLTVKLIYEQLRNSVKYLGVFGCGPLLYLLHWTGKSSHWIIMLMTVDRVIAVCFPFKVSIVSTRRNVTLAMVLLILFQAGVNSHYLFSNKQTTRGGGITCATKPEYRDFRSKTLWLFFTLSSIIPCGGVLVMNLTMAVKMLKISRNKGQLVQDEKQKSASRNTNKVTIMLVTVSLAFLLLVTPGPVFYLYITYWNFRASVEQTALYYLLRETVNAFINADHAINFFLYFLSGTKFRQSFLGIFHRQSQKSTSSRQTAMTSTYTKPSDRPESSTANAQNKV